MIIVLSPHMDDAVLSLGQHIINWKKQGRDIKVVTVFTKFGNGVGVPNYSNDYIQKSGFDNVGDFEKARIKEDIVAMKKLGVEYEHWGYIDAGFRGGYDTREKLLAGKINSADEKLVLELSRKINNLDCERCLLPFGVGGHVDHLIVKKAGEMSNKARRYYLDSPYLWQNFNLIKYLGKIITAKGISWGNREKDEVLKCYKSQYGLLGGKKAGFGEVLF
jgi:LmbE family N-acetylglucosaminyl deacetylase